MRDNYLNLALQLFIRSDAFDRLIPEPWVEDEQYSRIATDAISEALNPYVTDLEPALLASHWQKNFQALVESGAIVYEGDEYIDPWFRLERGIKKQAINNLLANNPAYHRYTTLQVRGQDALSRAIKKAVTELKNQSDSGGSDIVFELSEVPASDRIVRLNHNQIADCDRDISNLIDELEKDNGDPHHPGLRERVMGQVKAGRELIRAGEFRAYLLYEVLLKALAEIVDKYGNETIKALANALLGAIFSKIFEG